MPMITVSPGQHSSVIEGNTLTLKVYMMWSKQGGGLETGASNNVIAIYDLDLYIQHQRDLKASGESGFLETDDTFFKETNRNLGTLQDHRVAPGTGVMLLSDVTFRFHDPPVQGVHFFVERVALQGANSPQPYALDVKVIGRFDDKGNPLTKGPIGLISLGRASVSRKDFDALFVGFKNFQRKIAVRVFKPDMSRVLLSNIDPEQSTTSQGQHKVHYKTVGLTRSLLGPRNVGDPGTGPQEGADPPTRLRTPDLSGYFVEEVEPNINKDGIREIDPATVVAPAGLFIHEAGHAFVGWYSPLPDKTLIASAAGFDARNNDVRNKMLSSSSRIVFVGPMLDLPAELQGKVPDAMPPGATPVLYFDDTASNTPLEVDPVQIIRKQLTPVKVGWFRVIQPDISPIVELGLESGKKAEFLSAHTGTRLSWETIKSVRNAPQLQGHPDAQFFLESLLERADPVPPGVTAKLVTRLVGQAMFDQLKKISELPPKGDSPDLIIAENAIIDIVDGVIEPLRDHHKSRMRLMAETTMRSHNYKFADGNKSVFERLVTMATNRFERRVKGVGADKGSLEANIAEHLPKSFAELGLHPKKGFKYTLVFSAQGISGGTFVQGSAGGFGLDITKEREVDGKFVKDTTFDVSGATAKYFGAYLGGGVGFSAGYGFKGKTTGGGGSGAPVDVTIETFHNITAEDLNRASFTTAAFVKPSFGISAGPVGGGTEFHETVLTLRVSEQIQISGEVRGKFLEPKVSPPSLDSMQKHFREWQEAVTSGDLSKIPTPGVNATLVALTMSMGILFKRDSKPAEEPKPKKQDEVPKSDDVNADQQLDGLFFETGKAEVDAGAHNLLDVSLATARHLFELEGWLVIFACTSPKFNDLNRKDARGQNQSLARFRADQARKAIFASLGGPGGGIIPRDKDVETGIDVDSAVRQTLTSPGGLSVLDPHGDVAKTAEGKKVVQREERDVYPLLQRCDILVNGLLEVRLATR